MKKGLTVLLMVVLSITCLFGCKKEPNIEYVEYYTAYYTDYDKYLENTEKIRDVGKIPEGVFVYEKTNIALGNFEEFWAYASLMRTNKDTLDKTYDREDKYIYIYDFNNCYYKFSSEDGIEFKINFDGYWEKEREKNAEYIVSPDKCSYKDEYLKEHKDYTKRYSPENTADMRTFGKKITGVYTYNDVLRYTYEKGVLKNVHWILDNEVYVEVSSSKFSEYSLESDLIYSKLLNLDTALQAITEVFGEPTPIKAFFAE